MRYRNKEILFGLYNDEEDLLRAVKYAKEKHLDIHDVLSPFPVHGLDSVLGLRESRLHMAGFVYGLIGTLTAFLFMTWVFTRDWPIIFGGKPYWSVPSFIPITFELTVLFASIGMVVTFFATNGQGPGVNNVILDDRITDDKFCIAFEVKHDNDALNESYHAFFKESGAHDVRTKII